MIGAFFRNIEVIDPLLLKRKAIVVIRREYVRRISQILLFAGKIKKLYPVSTLAQLVLNLDRVSHVKNHPLPFAFVFY